MVPYNWLTKEGLQILNSGIIEIPLNERFKEISIKAANLLNNEALAEQFYKILSNNWLCLSTPILANFGTTTNKGLPISCYGRMVPDTTSGIFETLKEGALLTKYGGGLGTYFGKVRGRGSKISSGGISHGVAPWLKLYETAIDSVAQGTTRRGAEAIYLDVDHPDFEEFLEIRRPTGDISKKCLSVGFHHAIILNGEFMKKVEARNPKEFEIFKKILKSRVETGEPYIMFKDNANKNKAFSQKIITSQLCNEIYLPCDESHTFVCCLASLNLAKFDEWANTNVVELAIYFLEAVMEEFILKTRNMEGFERAFNFAIKARALGLGVLGWHTYLQKNNISLVSPEAFQLNASIFKKINEESLYASRMLGQRYGVSEWCKSQMTRHLTRLAIAPTSTNSIISGNVSQGIEPINTNIFVKKTAKGNFIQKNPVLENLLKSRKKNTKEIWDSILENNGSVQHLDCLSQHEKEIFLTASEIPQGVLIKQAAQRQQFIDQGQSLNLFFPSNSSAKYIYEVHLNAWKLGLKGLYYLRSSAPIKGDISKFDCNYCEG